MSLHYIRKAVDNTTGNDWTDLPASLVRGDTYYIADGAYTNYVFDDALDD